MLKLNANYTIYYKRRGYFDLIQHVSSTIVLPPNTSRVACWFAEHVRNQYFQTESIQGFLDKGFVVVYFCDKLPVDGILSDRLVYVLANWAQMSIGPLESFETVTTIGFNSQRAEQAATSVSRSKGVQRYHDQSLDNLPKKTITLAEETTILFDTIYGCGDRGLGDIVMTTSIVKALKRQFHAKIYYACRPAAKDLLLNNPDIEGIFIDEDSLKGRKFTYHLPLVRHLEDYKIERNRQCRLDSLAELYMVELTEDEKRPQLFLTQAEILKARSETDSSEIKVGINVEATAPARRWYAKYLKEFLKKIVDQRGVQVFLLGSGKTIVYEDVPEEVRNFVGKTTLRESIALTSCMDYMICTDSLYSHVAGAFDIPQVTLYTNIPAEWRLKYYRGVAVQGTTKCSPCYDFQFVRKEDYAICDRYGVPACVKSITPKLVIKAIKQCVKKYPMLDRGSCGR